MTSLETLERRIHEKLATSDAHWHAQQDELRRQMRERETLRSSNAVKDGTDGPKDDLSRYTEVADRLVEVVIRPRLEKLIDCFDNAHVPEGQGGPHRCVYRFERIPRFPATAALEVAVSRDGQAQTVEVCWDATIIPAYGAMPPPGRLTFPVNAVEEERVAAWVEENILAFLDAYLRLEMDETYQDENLTNDPVCGMLLNKASAPARSEYGGVTFYFCNDHCRSMFLKEMEHKMKDVLS